MTPPLYETPAPPSSSIQVTFAFFVGTSENRIARLPRYPDSPNMALALHAARRPTLLFEFLDYPHQSLNFLFLESFVVQPQLRIGGSIGIQRDQSKAYLPLSTSVVHSHAHPYIWCAIVHTATFRPRERRCGVGVGGEGRLRLVLLGGALRLREWEGQAAKRLSTLHGGAA